MDLQTYLDLIPAPNNLQPNLLAWLSGILQPTIDTMIVLGQLTPAFDINTAVGDQLDVLGQILNLSRILNFQPDGGINPVLDDPTYRIVLIAKIIQNQWDGSKGELYTFLQTFLPQYPVLIADNQNMTMNVLVLGMANAATGAAIFSFDLNASPYFGFDVGFWFTITTSLLRQLVVHGYFTPKPAGVHVNYSFSDGVFFALDTESTFLQGFDQGSWASF